jgi:AraC-like DNA-binding protein
LERPFVTRNAELLAMLAPQLDAELSAGKSRQTLGEQVKGTLKRLLAGQRPTIHTVARQLSLSSRTLQRRLAESDVTFQQLLDEARRDMARHYLRQSSLELNETAYLLGYEDPNSFFSRLSRLGRNFARSVAEHSSTRLRPNSKGKRRLDERTPRARTQKSATSVTRFKRWPKLHRTT